MQFTKIEILPRWIIFSLDLAIISISLLSGYLLYYRMDVAVLAQQEIPRNVLIILLSAVAVFWHLKTYRGIVRYTSAQDMLRILAAVLIINGNFLLLNLVAGTFWSFRLIPWGVLIISTLTSFLLLSAYRVFVKYMFIYIGNANLERVNVLIYGAGEAGIATKRTLDHDIKYNKRIIAFLDDDPRKTGKKIDGIDIAEGDKLDYFIDTAGVNEVIMAVYNMPYDKKTAIVDACLARGVKVLSIPAYNEWANGILKSTQINKIEIEDLLNRKPIKIDTDGIGKELNGKRILITGAAGSIGSEIVRQLLHFNAGMIILCDQSETALHYISLEITEGTKSASYVAAVADVRDEVRMRDIFEKYKPQYVYHAAAYKHVPLMEDNPAEAVKANVLGTYNLANLALEYGVRKFVMVSTDKAVNPTNVMGATKRIAEIYVQALNKAITDGKINGIASKSGAYVTKFITTRFGNVLGSNGSVIPRFKEQIEKGGPITVTHPDITRYFMTIPEACRLVLEAGYMGQGGEIFVFDMGKSVKITDLANNMIKLAGLTPGVDIQIAYTGLRPGEKLYEELLNDSENTLPTHHAKIMIGKTREYDFTEVKRKVSQLISTAARNAEMDTVREMKAIVPEFKSQNSKFEVLDAV